MGFAKEKTARRKDHHERRMLWPHLVSQALFISCAAFHSPTKWSQKASRKAVWQRKLLAAFLCRERQGHSINLQTLCWSFSPPLLVFLRLLQLLLGEWHCI